MLYNCCIDEYNKGIKIEKIILEDGTIEYKNESGDIHNVNDEPAVIYSNGTKMWCKNGELHRDNDLPAIIESDGTKMWYKNGKLHRDNEPAIILHDGTIGWFKEGRVVS